MELMLQGTQAGVDLFNFLYNITEQQENKVIFILVVIVVLMALDFITGSIAAWVSDDIKFCSQEGINGLLRKLCSILLLVCCIPISVLIPYNVGLVTITILYLGYLFMEFSSILENLEKLGVEVNVFKEFLDNMKKNLSSKNNK